MLDRDNGSQSAETPARATGRRAVAATRSREEAGAPRSGSGSGPRPGSEASRDRSDAARDRDRSGTVRAQDRSEPARDPRRELGALGEQIALRHVRARGFAPLARNHRTRLGEIDLIAFDGRTLLFVEVKSRRVRARRAPGAQRGPSPATVSGAAGAADAGATAPARGSPADAAIWPLGWLGHRQRRRLRRLARAWLQECRSRPRAREIRFDAIGVLVDEHDRLLRLDHIEGAW